MRLRPFNLPSGQSRERIAAALQHVVDDWRADWGVVAPCVVAVRERDGRDASRRWQPCTAMLDCWFDWPGMAAPDLALELFGPGDAHGTGQVAGALAAACSNALQAGLLARLGPTLRAGGVAANGLVPAARPGDGVQFAQLTCGHWQAALLLDYDACARLAPPPVPQSLPPLSPMAFGALFSHQPQRLRVELGQARAPMGQLASLQIGDVIRLSSSLGSALTLRTADGQCVAVGQLVRHGESRALAIDAP